MKLSIRDKIFFWYMKRFYKKIGIDGNEYLRKIMKN